MEDEEWCIYPRDGDGSQELVVSTNTTEPATFTYFDFNGEL